MLWLLTPVRGHCHEKEEAPLSLSYVYNRSLELLPCGCMFNPQGGVVREKNVLDTWVKDTPDLFHFTVGTSFVAEPSLFNKKDLSDYKKKSAFLVRAMNELSTKAFFLSPSDTYLGVTPLKKILKEAKFPIVTTNLLLKKTKKPLFEPSCRFDWKGTEVLVLGVFEEEKYYKPSKEIEIQKPELAIKQALSGLKEPYPFVIVASNLPRGEQQSLSRLFPQIRLWMGGQEGESQSPRTQLSDKVLAFSSLAQGKEIVRLKINLKTPFTKFYSQTFGDFFAFKAKQMEREIASLQSEPKTDKELLSNKQSLYEGLASIPSSASPEWVNYDFDGIRLTKQYDLKTPSPLKPLIDEYLKLYPSESE